MSCKRVLSQLSLLIDDMLDGDEAAEVKEHLGRCAGCRAEVQRLAQLRKLLGSMRRVPAPEYLHHLVLLRLANAQRNTWHERLRNAIGYWWSKIRTTEGIWYLTRLAGTAAAFVLFLTISYSVHPIYLDIRQPVLDRGNPSQALRQQLPISVLKNLGLTPVEAQKKPISPSDPMINDLYFLHFGQSASRRPSDDSFSVVTVVDRSGAAKIQNVLEYPADSTLLADFNDMIMTARCRPASQNGRAVDSHLVLSFSKISVYD